MKLWLRLAIGLVVVGLCFLVDRSAFAVLRAATLYEYFGEVREGLTAAKFLGSGLGTLLVGLAIARLDPRSWRRTAVLWMVVLLTGVAVGVVKVACGRERPSHLSQPVGRERMAFHGPVAGVDASFQSFPSGHTATSFASATCLAAFYPPAGILVYGIATATAVNRVVKHQHFLSDAAAGALLGHLLALVILHRPRVATWWFAVDRRDGAT